MLAITIELLSPVIILFLCLKYFSWKAIKLLRRAIFYKACFYNYLIKGEVITVFNNKQMLFKKNMLSEKNIFKNKLFILSLIGLRKGKTFIKSIL